MARRRTSRRACRALLSRTAVVIAESTRKLLGNLFELEDLGAQDLKGITGPVRAWAALRPSSVESRFDALHAGGLTDACRPGRRTRTAAAALVEGKERRRSSGVALRRSRHRQIAAHGGASGTASPTSRISRLRYFCSPQHTDSALYPIIGQMERAAGFAHDDTTQAKLDKLDALLAQTATSSEDAALFADMLSLPNDGRYPTLELASAAAPAENARGTRRASGGAGASKPGADDL